MSLPGKARITFYYHAPTQNVGWSETWTLLIESYDDGLNKGNAYVPLRRACLLSTARITNFRVSDANAARDSKVHQVLAANGVGAIDIASNPSAGTNDALLVRKDDINNDKFNHLFLHFVPEAIFLGRRYIPGLLPAFDTAFDALAAWALDPDNAVQIVKGKGAGRTYTAIAACDPVNRTTHRVGRPFGLAVGRR